MDRHAKKNQKQWSLKANMSYLDIIRSASEDREGRPYIRAARKGRVPTFREEENGDTLNGKTTLLREKGRNITVCRRKKAVFFWSYSTEKAFLLELGR